MELSTYFRINAANTGQFERTLIIADEGAYVSYLEGCTAPMRDENQLHAAVVELVALDDAEIKYSTVQNWYPGDEDGKGGIYNFVTKRGACRGAQLEDLAGRRSRPARRSPGNTRAASCRATTRSASSTRSPSTNNRQQADTGTKMIHIGQNTPLARSSPRASPPAAARTPIAAWCRCCQAADGARNYTQCDSLLIGDRCGAHTVPYIEVKNPQRQVEHEATHLEDQRRPAVLLPQRGIAEEDAVSLIVNGFCKRGVQGAADGVRGRGAEAAGVSLEGSVG